MGRVPVTIEPQTIPFNAQKIRQYAEDSHAALADALFDAALLLQDLLIGGLCDDDDTLASDTDDF